MASQPRTPLQPHICTQGCASLHRRPTWQPRPPALTAARAWAHAPSPALNRKHLPPRAYPHGEQASRMGILRPVCSNVTRSPVPHDAPTPIHPLVLSLLPTPGHTQIPTYLLRKQEKSGGPQSGKLRLVQAPHLLCTPSVAMATSSGALSLWSPHRLPLSLQATVPRPRAQPTPDLSHQLHPSWAGL